MRGTSRLLAGAVAAVLVLSAAACGGGGNKTTTTSASGTSAVEWANGVCSSFTAWTTSLKSIKTSVASQPSKSQLRKAERQVENATETLARSLKQLGKPDTAQGEAAKKNLDTLATTLQSGMNELKKTLNSSSSGTAGALSQISAMSATLATMANSLKLAGANLKNFAPSQELQQAFHQASACKQYIH